MWAKIITIKRTKDLNYFSLCAFNLFNTQVSQFELNYWNKWTFPRHSNLLRCTCIAHKSYGQKEQHALSSAYQLFNSTEGSHENVTFWGDLSILFLSDAVTKHKCMPHDYHTHTHHLSLWLPGTWPPYKPETAHRSLQQLSCTLLSVKRNRPWALMEICVCRHI